MKKFEIIKMRPRESLNDFDQRFNNIIIKLAALEKEYQSREVALKVMQAIPRD